MEEKKYWVWLASLPGVGCKRFLALVDYFKTAKNVFECSYKELIEANVVPIDVSKKIYESRCLEKIDTYIKKAEDMGVKIYTYSDEVYPENLKSIFDPPPVLYVKGEILSEDQYAIGMVGSRKASDYGMKTAEKIAFQLAENGITVVSGMALGIDSAAHKGAIRAGGRTIAVFGCGLGHVHPKSGVNLSKEIIKNGALISEYPIGIEARPEHFPARNRIISGMSKGIVVVEAALKSGTLITTDFALEQGRDVFAVPGNINSPNSKGTNNLIKNGAKLVDCVEDILEELNFYDIAIIGNNTVKNRNSTVENRINSALNSINNVGFSSVDMDLTELAVINCLKDTGRALEEIIGITGLNSGDAISITTMLEIKGIIVQIDGIFYLDK